MQRGLINHLDLTVSDLEASCVFYDKVLSRLGYTRTSDYEGAVPCWAITCSAVTLSIGLHRANVATPHDRHWVGLSSGIPSCQPR